MRFRFTSRFGFALTLACVTAGLAATPAHACGGFFCSQTQPVNQAAERIIFANNGDGSVTAVIQIMYEGPAENFSWLLPISTVPAEGDLTLASDIAFQRLQQATNPQFNLTTRVEGRCGGGGNGFNQSVAARPESAASAPGTSFGDESGVSVAASGSVGAFEWVTLALDPELPEPADAAVRWLTENGYDVPESSEGLLAPYLQEQGMYLLALRLTKGADVGSIRPIVLRYAAELPMIPIKLTAVAANDDMGVMTWVSAPARAVPFNYLGLELNEARINWFNAASNYEAVVTAAANDAGGQGFVTEFAGASSTLANVIWTTSDEQNFQDLTGSVYSSFSTLFERVYSQYQGWDGFWEAMERSVTLPASVRFADFKSCPSCYSRQIQFSPSALFAALEADVVEPVRRVQQLIDAQPYLTRLYSTLSASDMTVDPVFAENADLGDVDNVHSAERVIECNDDIEQFEAGWRIELPQGGIVRGTANDVGSWPTTLDSQPPNLRVLELSAAGPGRVLQDYGADIDAALGEYNANVPRPEGSGGFCNVAVGRVQGGAGAALALLAAGLTAAARRRRSSALTSPR